NIVTIYQGDHLKNNLIHTALLGATFVLACDIVGRIFIYPYEIPINLTVGVIGSGIFVFLLLRRKRYGLYEKNYFMCWYGSFCYIVICHVRVNRQHWLYLTATYY